MTARREIRKRLLKFDHPQKGDSVARSHEFAVGFSADSLMVLAMKNGHCRFSNAPPRYMFGEWPAEMRMDVVAAFLDFPDTRALQAAVERGEAPRPTSMRRIGRLRSEPVWSAEAIADFVRRRHARSAGSSRREEGLESLVSMPSLPKNPPSGS